MGRIETQEPSAIYKKAFEAGKEFSDEKNSAPIALSIVTGKPYDEVHAALKKHGRVDGKGTIPEAQELALKDLGFEIEKINYIGMADFIAEYPGVHKKLANITTHHPRRFPLPFKELGISLWFSDEHVSAFMDGKIHDHAVNNSRRVITIWKIKKVQDEQQTSRNNWGWAGRSVMRLHNEQEWIPGYCS